jgi:hypothetical protein
MKISNHFSQLIPLGLFGLVFSTLLLTVAPTVYTLDSAEFALGAKTLGLVHAPGYPLYLVIAHLFTYLPVGDIAYRVNLFSALCLALTAPIFYLMIGSLIEDRWIAATSALVFVWSHYSWINGIVAEVYGPQLLTLSATGWLMARLYRQAQSGHPGWQLALLTGVSYGIAVAMVPTSILFAPGLVAAYLLLRIPWKTALFAALLAVGIFAASLLYFPLRYQADPKINVEGTFDPSGHFHPIDLQNPTGIWKVVKGEQFKSLFFAEGYLPTIAQVKDFAGWFGGNFLGIGIILGLIGGYVLYTQKRGIFGVWLCALLPYTYFFLAYGAEDVEMMFSPTYLVWAVALAYGLHWALDGQGLRFKQGVSVALIGLFLVVNFPLANVSDDRSVRDQSEAILAYLPADSLVFGQWLDVVPLQYLQEAEDSRPDITLYNVALFTPAPYFPFFDDQHRPMFALDKLTVQMYVSPDQYDAIPHPIMDKVIYELRTKGEN